MNGPAVNDDRTEIATTLADFDFNRSPRLTAQSDRFKHWIHMTIVDPAIAIVANFSSTYVGNRARAHQLTLLVYGDGVSGCVRRFVPQLCRIPLGRASIRFDRNQIVQEGDSYKLELSDPELDLRVSLVLKAVTRASSLQNIRLGEAGMINWVVIPRLVAGGTVEYAGRSYALVDAPAYRDRNWGSFNFGDVTWDWGYALAKHGSGPEAYTVVFARLMSRGRARVIEQDLLIWRGQELLASFRDGEVTFRATGRVTGPLVTVPASLSLCRPGTATDVPTSLTVNARSTRGHVELRFRSMQTARVVVPNDARPGTSVIHETLGRCEVTGQAESFEVDFEGQGFLECVDV